jgi:outer membrane autotransporter protein
MTVLAPGGSVSTNVSCQTWAFDTGTSWHVAAGGSLGNAIFQGGALTIDNGGTLAGLAEAGGPFTASDPGALPTTYGGVGSITVLGGGTLASAVIGAGSSLVAGEASSSAPKALLGYVNTYGTTLIQNTDIDIGRALGGAGSQTSGVVVVGGGHTTIIDSQLHNQLGDEKTGLLMTDLLAGPQTALVQLDMTNSTIDTTGLGLEAVQQPGGRAPYILNLTNVTITTSGADISEALSLRDTTADGASIDATVTGGVYSGKDGVFLRGFGPALTLTANQATFIGTTQFGAYVNGAAQATFDDHSVITGATDGLVLQSGFAPGSAVIGILNGTQVQGQNGAAIHVRHALSGPNPPAIITIASGATLAGANGNILQVDNAGQAQVTADGVALTGNVLVSGAGSSLALGLQNNAAITGTLTANGGAAATLQLAQATLNGAIVADGAGSTVAAMLGANGTLNGDASATAGGAVSVQGTDATAVMSGAVSADNASAVVQLSNGARVLGGLRLANGASGTVAVDGQGSTLARADGAAVDVGSGSTATVAVTNGGLLAGAGGLLVNATGGGNATVTLANTTLNGDMTRDAASTLDVALTDGAVLTGNLAASTLAIGNGAIWNMGSQAQQSIGALTLDNGEVDFGSSPGAFKTLTTGSLQGSGIIHMGMDFTPGGGNDLLTVTGAVHGAPLLDPQEKDQGVEDPRNNVLLARTGGGDPLALLGGKVDAGIYTYRLQQDGDTWSLVRNGSPDPDTPPDPEDLSPAAQTALSLAASLPWIWYGELGTLRLREGDLRANRAGDGLWVRTYSSFSNLTGAAAPDYSLDQYGLTVGGDKRLVGSAGDWYVGGFGAYSYSTVGIDGGSSGRVDSYSLGGYATWLGTNGWYADGVLKANEFDSDIRVVNSDGSIARGGYRTPGLGMSLEVGKHYPLANNGFVEPYLQATGFMSRNANDQLDSGFNIETGTTKSFQSELGVLTGTTFHYGNHGLVQPYIKAALAHEFVASNRVVLNGQEFDNGTTGTIMKVGVGVAAQVRDNLQLHLDADYATGGPVDHATHLTLGMRYAF